MHSFKILVIIILYVLFKNSLNAEGKEKNINFLPEGMLFSPLIFDPTESQYYGGLFALKDTGSWNNEVYIPISLVLKKPIFRFENDNYEWEIGLEGAGFTQFDILKIDRKTALGKMLNTDYRGGIFINFAQNIYAYRFRYFHSSSHLADDYILKVEVSPRTPSELDYEQADFTFSIQKKEIRLYAGTGMVVSPNTVRKRFSSQLGGYYIKQFSNNNFAYLGGIDIKLFQQNDYRPNLKCGAGIEIGSLSKMPLRFIIEYYNGHLPYSTLEYKLVQWFGLSLSFGTQ